MLDFPSPLISGFHLGASAEQRVRPIDQSDVAIDEKGSVPKSMSETEITSSIRSMNLEITPNRNTAESAANASTEIMSLQPSGSNAANKLNRVEGLKVWSCVSCRRRKVRCDRRHPCAPCIRNKAECLSRFWSYSPPRSRRK